MAGMFSELEKFGISIDDDMSIFDDQEEKKEESSKKEAPKVKEEDFLLDKNVKCPICEKSFKNKAVKSGKLRVIATDKDLRPKFNDCDANKYGVTVCTHCGYAALDRYFVALPSAQEKLIKQNISAKFDSSAYDETEPTYSYDTAIDRYKLALVNTIVKKGKMGERAYCCLKTAWVIRGKMESLSPEMSGYELIKAECEKEELTFLKNALEGFLKAIMTETFPICGLDEGTVYYVIVILAMRFKKYELASKTLSNLLTSKTVTRRIKDKALDLKEELIAEVKANR